MVNDINWEISLPSLSNKSTQEIIDVINHILSSDFKEIDVWLNKQVENNNLKSFKRELAHNVNFNQRDFISILDLQFNKIYFKIINLI